MMGALGALRHLLGRWNAQLQSPAARGQEGGPEPAEKAGEISLSVQEHSAVPSRDELSARRAGREDDSPSPRIARHVMAYLNARAEEALAHLLEELSRETAREVAETLEENRQAVSAEIAEVREGIVSSQREFSRIGRELVRSGATLESIREAVAALGPAVERMESSLRSELMQEHARERRLREEAEQAALDDILATLDGLEAGLEHGRELVQALAETQRRLKDSTVQRWWRAMGEATGVKHPLPDVPVDDVEGWMRGLELTRRRLLDALVRRGVTPIDSVGKPFDPYLHEAVAVEPCPPERDGVVLREERRGYRAADRIVRLSQVVVGQAAPPGSGTRQDRPSRAAASLPSPEAEPSSGKTPKPRDSRGRFRRFSGDADEREALVEAAPQSAGGAKETEEPMHQEETATG
mgnify:FL=1